MNNSSFFEDLLTEIDQDLFYDLLKALACFALLKVASFTLSAFQDTKKSKVDKLEKIIDELRGRVSSVLIISSRDELQEAFVAIRDNYLNHLKRKPSLHSEEILAEFTSRLDAIEEKAKDTEQGFSSIRILLSELIRDILNSCYDAYENVGLLDPIFPCTAPGNPATCEGKGRTGSSPVLPAPIVSTPRVNFGPRRLFTANEQGRSTSSSSSGSDSDTVDADLENGCMTIDAGAAVPNNQLTTPTRTPTQTPGHTPTTSPAVTTRRKQFLQPPALRRRTPNTTPERGDRNILRRQHRLRSMTTSPSPVPNELLVLQIPD